MLFFFFYKLSRIKQYYTGAVLSGNFLIQEITVNSSSWRQLPACLAAVWLNFTADIPGLLWFSGFSQIWSICFGCIFMEDRLSWETEQKSTLGPRTEQRVVDLNISSSCPASSPEPGHGSLYLRCYSCHSWAELSSLLCGLLDLGQWEAQAMLPTRNDTDLGWMSKRVSTKCLLKDD